MRISDWSSDVCSSGLEEPEGTVRILVELGVHRDMMFALARRADHHIGAVGQGFPELLLDIVAHRKAPSCPPMIDQRKSEERGVGKECAITLYTWWSPVI